LPPRKRRALITGITGQDGWYLTRLLQEKGYAVHGLANRRPGDALAGVSWHLGDITDAARLLQLFEAIRPDEVYNLSAQSQVRLSFEMPVATARVNALGAICLLEAVRQHGRPVRLFQPVSSDMFGDAKGPCAETAPFRPRSPYATSKLYAFWQVVNYREAYGLFACNGILFNHESPRRPPHFVTRKITRAAARIKLGLERTLRLGNIDIERDWGFAGDTVRAMWLMLQRDRPDDYVVATGRLHSLRDFLREAFGYLGLDWRRHVEFDPFEVRPTDVRGTCGNAAKARRLLRWRPTVDFQGLVRMMVDADLESAR
jgi:GDPmannose 4,6-dehydratase